MRLIRPILAALTLLSAALWAEPVSQLHPSNYVNDFAHVLNTQTEDQLNSICEQLDHQAKAQVAVVTVNTLEGQDVESYAVDLFHKWGIGSKSNDHGVLILLAIQDHRGRIEVGYGLEPILPDGKTGGFNREAIPFLKQGDYDAAIRLMTIRVADVIAQDAGIQLTGSPQAPRSNYPAAPGISLGRIALLVIIAIIVLASPLRTVDTAAAADGVEAVLVAEAAEADSEALAAAPPVAVVRALVGEEKQWHTRQSLTNLSKR